MKHLATILAGLTVLLAGFFIGYTAHERARQHQIYTNPDFENPVFIWNDDLESIPKEGSDIKIDLIQSDTIYLSPKN